jgi:pimeloyl-ACP methyl ester carboxylesterase
MFNYPDFRTYGEAPYDVALIHGGPGAPGELAPLAEKLSLHIGVLEPLQKQCSIEGQVSELAKVLQCKSRLPITLVGWSWGAMLSLIFTSQYPNLVKKLILINSGPLDEIYVEQIVSTRDKRLSDHSKAEMHELARKMKDPNNPSPQEEDFKKFVQLFFLADGYEYGVKESPSLDFQFELYQKVWNELKHLRQSGQLLAYAQSITCPTVIIHGDYDPRPFQGVRDPLSATLKNLSFYLLEKCGHYPWFEKYAGEKFYEILLKEIQT